MNKENNKTTYTGVGFSDLLGLVFIVLKLTHVIDWSWWLVLLPIYLPLLIIAIVILVIVIIASR